MSAFGQFDAGYNQQEDRILLRITNTDNEEFRFWLTRRVCAALLTDFKARTSAYRISAVESGSVAAPQGGTAGSDHETLLRAQLEQEAAVAQQDFKTTFKSGENFPLGKEGILVERIDLKPNAQGQDTHSLSFADAQGKGITLGVSIGLFNSIFEVIERVVRVTDWSISPAKLDVRSSKLLQ